MKRKQPKSLSTAKDSSSASGELRDDYGLLDAPYKLLLIVNMALKMEKGKICAQCGHATLGAYKRCLSASPSSLAWWERTGQAKIALKAENEKQLSALREMAKKRGLVTYQVEDAGRTQVACGSRTVLAIGPAPVAVLNDFTRELKLL